MNTMEITKIVAGVCGALLIFLLLKMGAEAYYFGGHGGEHAEAAYTIEVAGADDHAEEVVEVPFAELLAAADIAKGEKVLKKCTGCHSVDPVEHGSSGPTLFGVVGRPQASTDFGSYTDALTGLGGDWTAEELNAFLTKPRDYAPGTGMSFAGLKERDRVNLIGYLATLN